MSDFIKDNADQEDFELNSREHLQFVRKLIQEESDEYSAYTHLEEAWHKLAYKHIDRNLFYGEPHLQETILAEFMFHVKFGSYPPPEVLVALWQCFDNYISCSGSVELEAVFFGKPVPGVGNFSARRFPEYLYRMIHGMALSNKPNASLEEKAETLLAIYDIDKDVSSFLRGYRRWRAKHQSRQDAMDYSGSGS